MISPETSMTTRQAKQILLLYRPGTADAEDPEIIEAVELARRDAELARWFAQHCAFQDAVRAKLRQVEVVPQLKAALLAGQKPVQPAAWWQRRIWLAAAGLLLLSLGLAVFFLGKYL
jgi:hypothetical protein